MGTTHRYNAKQGSGWVSPWEYVDFDLEINELRALAATLWSHPLRREKCKRRWSTSGDSRKCLGMSTELALSK